MKKYLFLFVSLFCHSHAGNAQLLYDGNMSLQDAIQVAYIHSPNAQMAQLSFMSRYWNYRSYKAQMLPSLTLSSGLGEYNRSVVEARDPETGHIRHVSNNTLNNSLSVHINQKIVPTGGHLSLNTSLSRLDQFTYDEKTYNSTPLSLSYSQPFFSYNTLKWQKKTEPLAYEKAKKVYLETMEGIVIQTTSYFFSVLSAQTTYQKNEENLEDTRRMYQIAEKRYELGRLGKNELLQLELAMMNAELALSNSMIDLEVALFNFKSFIGLKGNHKLNLIPPSETPNVNLEYDFVLDKARNNSSHLLDIQLRKLSASQEIAQAKANRGFKLQLTANVGFSQTDHSLTKVYQNLQDREVVGFTLSMPIYDWGVGKGRVKMAEAKAKLAQTEIDQEEIKFEQDIWIKVMQFNNQGKQCMTSAKALQIAKERYEITKKRFQRGNVTVTDLNTAQKELDTANNQYVGQLQTYWRAYFELRKLSLYDFISKQDISAEFDKIIEG